MKYTQTLIHTRSNNTDQNATLSNRTVKALLVVTIVMTITAWSTGGGANNDDGTSVPVGVGNDVLSQSNNTSNSSRNTYQERGNTITPSKLALMTSEPVTVRAPLPETTVVDKIGSVNPAFDSKAANKTKKSKVRKKSVEIDSEKLNAVGALLLAILLQEKGVIPINGHW